MTAGTTGLFLSTDTSLDGFDYFLGQSMSVVSPWTSVRVTRSQLRSACRLTSMVLSTSSPLPTRCSGTRVPIRCLIPARRAGQRLSPARNSVLEFADEGDNLQLAAIDVQFVATPDLVVDSVTTQSRVLGWRRFYDQLHRQQRRRCDSRYPGSVCRASLSLSGPTARSIQRPLRDAFCSRRRYCLHRVARRVTRPIFDFRAG